jgi:ABC-2 type transport system ATP-binding protein
MAGGMVPVTSRVAPEGSTSFTGDGLPGAIPRMPCVVQASGLGKKYGSNRVLRDVTFEISSGETFGVLGPNGAGKTTLIEILEGLRLPSEGEARVFGCPSRGLPSQPDIRRRIGVAAQVASLPQTLTVIETIDLFATIHGDDRHVSELISCFALEGIGRQQLRRLSGGQQQRVALAAALVSDPDLLFLDEPTAQLDPVSCQRLWEALRSTRRGRERTLVVTTHRMDEAQSQCDRVMIINGGRVIALDTPANLIRAHAPGVRVSFVSSRDLALLGSRSVQQDHGPPRWVVHTEQLEATIQQIFALSRTSGAAVNDLRLEPQTLREVFVNLAGEA